MPEVKPLKVLLKWRLRADDERAVYPDFPALHATDPSIFDNYPKAGEFFKERAVGSWNTNKQENLGTGAANGEAVILIPKANCDAILAASGYAGSEDVSTMNEAELETFWNTKAYAHLKGNKEHEQILQVIAAKKTLGIALSPDDYAALDPDDPMPGIVKSSQKIWASFKAKHDITIVT